LRRDRELLEALPVTARTADGDCCEQVQQLLTGLRLLLASLDVRKWSDPRHDFPPGA
jgi:hypothetical protein